MLREKFKNHRIILASQSPRRQELLKGLDIPFDIKTRPVEEVYDEALKKNEITDYLSVLKASAFNDLNPKDILITSDTIVWLNGKALGKPNSKTEAIEMLLELSGSVHEVFTSVTFTTTYQQSTIHNATQVHFNKLSIEEIKYYVDHGTPMDRAGSYGIQDWIGYSNIDKINGCYYNVMGLPLPKVYAFLKALDVHSH